ncbi:MAG: hypothetical protein AAF849_02650 [Bacteroidota bacterium]
MAIFHGSGFTYIKGLTLESNIEDFLQQIIPVLFIHPSFHLLALVAFGILAVFSGAAARNMLFLIAILVFVDAILGFYLGGMIPGISLSSASLLFALAAWQAKAE